MSDLWLPGYETQPIDAGLSMVTTAAPKVVVHTTETPPAPSLIAHWRANPNSGLPHFLGITPDRIVQLLPLNVSAYTLENPSGGIDTNRGGAPCIQIEVCEYAINPGVLKVPTNPGLGTREDWCQPGSPWCLSLGKWLAALVRSGVSLDLNVIDATAGTQWDGMSPAAWYGFNGVTVHRRAPEQPGRHWDCGLWQVAPVLAEAKRQLNPVPIPPTPAPPFEETEMFLVKIDTHSEIWLVFPAPELADCKVRGISIDEASGLIQGGMTQVNCNAGGPMHNLIDNIYTEVGA